MATQNGDGGPGIAASVFKAIFVVALVTAGIRGTSSFMKAQAADEALKAADPVIRQIVAEKTAEAARDALASLDAEQRLKLAGLSTTQPATQPAYVLADKDLVGTWNSTGTFTMDALSFKLNSVDTYNADGTWTAVSDTVWTFGKPYFDTKTSIRMTSKTAGTWKIDGNFVVETLTSREPRPADDVEAAKLDVSPKLANILLKRDLGQEPVRSRIVSATPSTITLSDEIKSVSFTTTMTRLSPQPVAMAAAR
jgi:hypothetical protein